MSTTPVNLITIHNVTAFHLLGNSTLPLTTSPSPLSLLSSPPSSSLTLSIGPLAFPLVSGVVFGTQEGNPHGYFLRPVLEPSTSSGGEGLPPGWIKLELPSEAVQSGDAGRFEEILVENGFLDGGGVSAEGVKSAASDLGAGIKLGAETVKEGIEQTAEKYQSSHSLSSTDVPTHFSSRTHSVLSSAASGSATAASYVASASDAVLGYAYKAGAALGDAVGLHATDSEATKEEEKTQLRNDVEGAFSTAGEVASSLRSGIAEGSSTIYNTATSAVRDTVVQTQGDEAGELASKAGETLANVGDIGKGALLGTSVIAGGAEVGRGATDGSA